MNPFKALTIAPAYGKNAAYVGWILEFGWEGQVFLFRSRTGEAPWEMVNPVVDGKALPLPGASYEDELPPGIRSDEIYYRATLVLEDGSRYDSPAVRPMGGLSRTEWNGACEMMRREHLRMTRGRNGIPAIHLIPLASGEVSKYFDPDTGQHLGPECPDEEDPAYGLKYVGGFGPPIESHMEFRQVGPITLADSPDGLGNQDPVVVAARLLAHPAPRRGHVMVHVPTDNRYVVGESPRGYFFRGLVPIGWDVDLHLLRRDDPRYRVPVGYDR